MIRNYIKIAFRNLIKNRLFSVVNIVGLTAGILFTMLIGAYIWSELQVNKGLRNADRQFFLSSKWKEEGMGMPMTTLAPIGRRLKEEYPSLVANYYRWDGITSVISIGDKRFREGIQIGDSTLLSMYGFELQAGKCFG
ncbi:MAG: ABC transporter permease [Spirosomaceae bacterium]|nr:ABC transporter permease [Spirosomataceae bacterium]